MFIRCMILIISLLFHSCCVGIIEEIPRSELSRLLPLLKHIAHFPHTSRGYIHQNINTEGSQAVFIAQVIRDKQQTYYRVQTPEDIRIITQDLASNDKRVRIEWMYVLKEYAYPRPPETYF